MIQKDLKLRIQEILQKHSIKQVDLAREIGIHHSTLSLWMQNKNKGRKQEISNSQSNRIDDLLERWCTTFIANKGVGIGTGNFRLPESRASNFVSHSVKPVLPISKFHIVRNHYNGCQKGHRQEIILRRLAKLQQDRPCVSLQDDVNECAKGIPQEPPKQLQLVPILIDLEVEGKKFFQTFEWNLNESHMPPEIFARIITEENQLPSVIEQEIANQIKKQVANFKAYYPTKNEMIKTVQLELRVDNMHYRDQLEWDLNNMHNCPEAFAELTVQELGLPQQYEPKFAHALRDSLQQIQKQMDTKNDDFGLLKKSTRTLLESSNYQSYKNILFSNSVSEKTWLRTDQNFGPEVELLDYHSLQNQQKLVDRKTRYVRRMR